MDVDAIVAFAVEGLEFPRPGAPPPAKGPA
jgi:hypothetical protein